ncbi:MAG: PEP-utilizing enzyme [Nitrospira sp.]|nr:PEP-utilizing enzyme [Nitrospira sp.]MCP9441955.1 PEP-utilizing enzyme [Nitrospira sp.]
MGLARLLSCGFAVPPGICITTEAYCHSLKGLGLDAEKDWELAMGLPEAERNALLLDRQSRIRALNISDLAAQCLTALRTLSASPETLPTTRWAVRSSATNEDAGHSSFAGLYRTQLGIPTDLLDTAITDLWASLWDERVLQYTTERDPSRSAPSMAVIIQPMLDPIAAGVAYSVHPITGRSFQIVVNAVPGLAAPLVEGQATPDQYVVQIGADRQPVWIRRRTIAHKSSRLAVTEEGLRHKPIPESDRERPSLSDEQLFELARTAKEVERAFGFPVDLEWAIDSGTLWILQARPITGIRPSAEFTNDDCEWSRTNLKETMPDLPSPLGLSFMERFMEEHIVAPYRRLGCRVPTGLSSTRVLYGRPYLNVTLFYMLQAQLRSDPSLLSEHMGGEPIAAPPPEEPLGWPAFLRAGLLMVMEMRRAVVHGPTWFAEMKRMAEQCGPQHIGRLSLHESLARLENLSAWIRTHELTFGIAGGVAQCLQVLNRLLPRWLGPDWRALSNAALQGQGTVISAQQILRLADLVHIARHEAAASTFFTANPWNASGFRETLKGTAFLRAFDAYLEDYGHRGVGESDIMSPRLADNPEAVLAVLRTQLGAASSEPDDILARQARVRAEALHEIKRRMGWRKHRWWIYLWWHRRLCRFFALREANRHHLMYFSSAIRRLLLHAGDLLASQGILDDRDDVFFMTLQETIELAEGKKHDWRSVIRARRLERAHNARVHPPDTIRDWETARVGLAASDDHDRSDLLSGVPISAGIATGPVRVLRSPNDWASVQAGEILAVPVIDPGMAPLFGIAGGVIAEMGGTLSHGAIIAREYGIPTVANVRGALSLLKDGHIVRLDAGAGTVQLTQPTHRSSTA